MSYNIMKILIFTILLWNILILLSVLVLRLYDNDDDDDDDAMVVVVVCDSHSPETFIL